MTEPQDEWRLRFQEMMQAEVSESLRRRILEEASQREREAMLRRQPRRTGAWKSWFAGLAGVCAAAVVAGVVWTDRSLPVAPTPPTAATTGQSNQLLQGTSFGLQKSQLVATGIKVVRPANAPGGPILEATVTNLGTTVVTPQDVVGVLGFTQHPGPGQDLLSTSNWIDFVNGPSTPLAPSQTATWSFNPIGVNVNSQGHIIGQPKLAFFSTKLVTAAKADRILTSAPGVQLQNVHVVPRSVSSTGRSFEVRARLVNTGNKPIVLNQLLSLVWFSPQVGASWTNSSVERFFDQVLAVDPSVTHVAPGQSTEVVLPPLIGSYTPNFLQWNANVLVIRHTW
ncbi:hypothetical protein [Alicyclobacillus sp. ALC3]|uniref:hypothetical protein n=1 Tax=Alicyclobacillus sp. ALC3 TaxID=2796143 RepID=UPI0023782E7B|nr:hypothetical protein [Alicyclobacillus sp. ALC3]WDL98071.1 hypothetical protein JC200_05030 [Alicyclobacillus sp. ALC3]